MIARTMDSIGSRLFEEAGTAGAGQSAQIAARLSGETDNQVINDGVTPMSLSQSDAPVTSRTEPATRKGRILVVLLMILLLGTLLRESGVLSLNAYGTKTASKWDTESTRTRNTSNRRPVDLRNTTLAVSVNGANGGVSAAALNALRTTSVIGSGPHQGQLTISLDKADLSGTYWLPLFKTGRCQFHATYKLEASGGASAVSLEGRISGQSDVKATGLCSIAEFRKVAGHQVAGVILQHIHQRLEQNQ